MSPEKLFHELLGLGEHWYVTQVEYIKGHSSEVRIVIKEKDSLFSQLKCAVEGADVGCYDHGKTRTWRHLNIVLPS